MKKISLALITTSVLFMSGCASIVNGTNQSVSVNTPNANGATCTLENNKGKWYVNSTPGSVTVHRSMSDLAVNCQKKHMQGNKKVASNTKPMAFGNVVFGGVIGAGVDIADGAAYDYPTDITVPMARA